MQVVFGAGPLGLAVVRELLTRGRPVRLATRTGRAIVSAGLDMVTADASDPTAVRRACQGAAVAYHCANAPYHLWPARLPAMMAGIIDGAASVGARLVYGDNVYMYGRSARPLTEDLPYRAAGPNGRTRAAVATTLMDAHAAGKVRAVIGRGSDFFGPHVRQSTVGERVFIPALTRRAAQLLGDPALPHTYTFIDDFARALVTLGERDEALGGVWHVPSAETGTTRAFLEMVFEEAGAPLKMAVLPEWAIGLLGVVVPTMRALAEQRYQRVEPFVVDHNKYGRAFGTIVTRHRDAIRQTLEWYRTQVGR